jgi:hypothetical protein
VTQPGRERGGLFGGRPHSDHSPEGAGAFCNAPQPYRAKLDLTLLIGPGAAA